MKKMFNKIKAMFANTAATDLSLPSDWECWIRDELEKMGISKSEIGLHIDAARGMVSLLPIFANKVLSRFVFPDSVPARSFHNLASLSIHPAMLIDVLKLCEPDLETVDISDLEALNKIFAVFGGEWDKRGVDVDLTAEQLFLNINAAAYRSHDQQVKESSNERKTESI